MPSLKKYLFTFSYYSAFAECFANKQWPPKGMPAVWKLLEELSRRGKSLDVVFFCRREFESVQEKKVVTLTDLKNVTFHIVPCPKCDIKGLRVVVPYIYQFCYVLKLLFKNNYNFGYCDREHVLFGAFLAIIGKKVVLRFHGVANLLKKKAFIKGFIPNLNILAFKAAFSYVICSKDGSPGERFIRRRCRKSIPYEILYNGVDLPVQDLEKQELRRKYDIDDKVPVILSVGRLDKTKGIDLLLDGLSKLDRDFLCIIVGAGDEEKNLKQVSQDNNLTGKVIFAGSMNHQQVFEFISLSDIFVSFNQYGNQSNAVLEAMKMGKAIVTYDTCQETYRDEQFESDLELRESMTLVDRKLTDTISEKLDVLLNDDELRCKKSVMVKNYSNKQLMSWKERIQKEVEIIEDLST